MPYKSKKQQRYMNATHPDIAAEWNQYPMPKYQASPVPISQEQLLENASYGMQPGSLHPSVTGVTSYPETPIASGRADYVPLEALALPGTPIIKGIGKLGNIAVDLANPLAGMGKNLSKGINKRIQGAKTKGFNTLAGALDNEKNLEKLNKIAKVASKSPLTKKLYKDYAFKIASQSPNQSRTSTEILEALLSGPKSTYKDIKYTGDITGIGKGNYWDNYTMKGRNLVQEYIYGNSRGFAKSNIKHKGLGKYTERYGDLKTYKLDDSIWGKGPLTMSGKKVNNKGKFLPELDPHSSEKLIADQQHPVTDSLLGQIQNHIKSHPGDHYSQILNKELKRFKPGSKGYYKKLGETIKKHKKITIQPESGILGRDDIGGHLVTLKHTPKKGFQIETQDIWKFTPEDYGSKWATDRRKAKGMGSLGRKAGLMDKAGKPFVTNDLRKLYLKKHGGPIPSYQAASTSITGYQGKGPDSGPYIIPDNNITMEGVGFPLAGTPIDNKGNKTGKTQFMKPGKNYKFPPGSSVYETPIMKDGGCIGYKCGGQLPMYFGGGDVNWGQTLGDTATMAGTGAAVGGVPGAIIGGVVGLGTSLYGQSNQFKADEQAQADWDAAQEQKAADAKQFSALNQYINPNMSATGNAAQPIDYGGSWGGLQTPMFSQSQGAPNLGTSFYQKGGSLPSYQVSPATIGSPYSYGWDTGSSVSGDAPIISQEPGQSLIEQSPQYKGMVEADKLSRGELTGTGKAEALHGFNDPIFNALLLGAPASLGLGAKASSKLARGLGKGFDYVNPLAGIKGPSPIMMLGFRPPPKLLSRTERAAFKAKQLNKEKDIIKEAKKSTGKDTHLKVWDDSQKHLVEDTNPLTAGGGNFQNISLYDVMQHQQILNKINPSFVPPVGKSWENTMGKTLAYEMPVIKGKSLAEINNYFANAPGGEELLKYLNSPGISKQIPGNIGNPQFNVNQILSPEQYEQFALNLKKIHQQGEGHLDLHQGNIMMKPSGEIAAIDPRGISSANWSPEVMEDLINRERFTARLFAPKVWKGKHTSVKSIYKEGGKLPSYQANDIGPPDYSPEMYSRFYDNSLSALAEEQERADIVNRNSLALAKRAAATERDFTRPLTGEDEDLQRRKPEGYTETPTGTRCYGDTCIYSATSLKGEAGAGHPPVTGNWTFRDKADKYGYENVPIKNKKPGDIIQYEDYGTPRHAVTYGGGDDIYFEPGGYRPNNPYRKDSYQEYLNHYGKGVAYRYVGKKKRLEQEAKEAKEKMLMNPKKMPTLGMPAGTAYNQQLMVQPPYQVPTGPLVTKQASAAPIGGYDSRIQPGSYDANTGKMGYRGQTVQQSWDNPDAMNMGDVPMNNPNPNVSSVPNMFMGYDQMGYNQEGGYLPEYQRTSEDIPNYVRNRTSDVFYPERGKIRGPEETEVSPYSGTAYKDPNYQITIPEWIPKDPFQKSMEDNAGGWGKKDSTKNPFPSIPKYKGGGGLSRDKDYGSKKKPYPSVSSGNFAGGGRSYPIPTRADAVDALRLAGLHGRSDVKSKVYAKYPGLKKKQEGGNIYNQENPHQGATFEAERPEVVRHEENNHPIALAHGGTVNNSSNFTRLTGNRHSDAEGGGQFKGAEGGFVYSDFIKIPKEIEEQFKNLV